jgi:hypothetical protein
VVRGDLVRRPRLLVSLLGGLATGAGLLVRRLPGLGALGCAVAGVWLLWGLGWALLAAVPFLVVAAYETP